MARQKDSTKTARQKPEVKTEKTKRTSDKAPIDKKSIKKPTINKTTVKVRKTKQIPNKFSKTHIDDKHSSLSARDKKIKEKLESMNAAVDSIKTAADNGDIIKLQETIRIVFANGVFLLKSLPRVRDTKLLVFYQRVHKKFERFIESMMFDIGNVERVTIDNCRCDGNKILLEKIEDDDGVFYYRLKYSNENTLISIFNEFGRPVYHNKTEPNGDRKFSVVSPSDHIMFEDEEKYEYDENKYTVMQSIVIDQELYGSYVGKNFDTREWNLSYNRETPELLDVNVVGLLFKNNDLQTIISRMKNRHMFDVKINLLFPSLTLSDSGKQVTQTDTLINNNETTFPETQKTRDTPIFLGTSIYKGRRTVLYSSAGVGKSLLSIAIGKSNEFQKCLYILIDDASDDNYQKYVNALGEKAILLTLKKIELKIDEINKIKNDQAFVRGYALYTLAQEQYQEYKNYRRAEEIMKNVKKSMKIQDETNNVVDVLLAIEIMINDAVENHNVDFICIDSLNRLVDDIRKLTKPVISRITKKAINANITMLCIHHTNQRGKIAGSSCISEMFDYVYKLSLSERKSHQENEINLFLEAEKSRYTPPRNIFFKAIFGDEDIPKYEELEHDSGIDMLAINSPQNLMNTILSVIDRCTEETISFTVMKNLLGRSPEPTDNAIKNELKKIENKGKIQKVNGRWDKIHILNKY